MCEQRMCSFQSSFGRQRSHARIEERSSPEVLGITGKITMLNYQASFGLEHNAVVVMRLNKYDLV